MESPKRLVLFLEFEHGQKVYLRNGDADTAGFVVEYLVRPESSIRYRVRWPFDVTSHYGFELTGNPFETAGTAGDCEEM